MKYINKKELFEIISKKVQEHKGLTIAPESLKSVKIIDEGGDMAVFALCVNEGLSLGANFHKDTEKISKIFGYDPRGFNINSDYLFAL